MQWRSVLLACCVVVAVPACAGGSSGVGDRQAGLTSTPCIDWMRARSIKSDSAFAASSANLACYDGALTAERAEGLVAWLESAPSGSTLVIRSAGGPARLGIDIGKLIASKKTTVVAFDLCASSCANYVFTVSPNPISLNETLVLFHGGVSAERINEADAQARAQLSESGLPPAKIEASVAALRKGLEVQLAAQRQLFAEAGLSEMFLERFDSVDADRIPASACTSGANRNALFLTKEQFQRIGRTVSGRLVRSAAQASRILKKLGAGKNAVCAAPRDIF